MRWKCCIEALIWSIKMEKFSFSFVLAPLSLLFSLTFSELRLTLFTFHSYFMVILKHHPLKCSITFAFLSRSISCLMKIGLSYFRHHLRFIFIYISLNVYEITNEKKNTVGPPWVYVSTKKETINSVEHILKVILSNYVSSIP